MTKKHLLILFCISLLIGISIAIAEHIHNQDNMNVTVTVAEPLSSFDGLYETVNNSDVTITALGDIMCHKNQIERAYDISSDSFNFDPSFQYVDDYLNSSDYTVGNLETTLAGRNQGYNDDVYGYCGYPRFNSPNELVDSLKSSGVDLFCTTNNHSLDSGTEGLFSTINYLDSIGVDHVGTYLSYEDSVDDKIVNINGMDVGFVAYTNITNGLTVSDDESYVINNLNYYSSGPVNSMLESVSRMKESECDIVVVFIHFGNEYVTDPDSSQTSIVDRLFDAGADVIIGSHPHVIQPMEIREITNDDGTTRQGVVIYSMGNFISCQTFEDNIQKDTGMIVDFTFGQDNGSTYIKKVDISFVYVYWLDNEIGLVPVLEASEDFSKYPFLSSYDISRINSIKSDMIGHVMSMNEYEYSYNKYKYEILLQK